MYRPLLALLVLATNALAEEKISVILFQKNLPDNAAKAAYPKPLPELGPGPIWNIGEYLRENGADISSGDLALWCPSSQRTFLHTSSYSVDIAESLVDFQCQIGTKEDMELQFTIVGTSPYQNDQTWFRMTGNGQSEHLTEISSTSNSANFPNVSASFEPWLSPDGKTAKTKLSFSTDGRATVEFDVKKEVDLIIDRKNLITETVDTKTGVTFKLFVEPKIIPFTYSIRMDPGETKDRIIKAAEAQIKES